ncbi:MAG: 4-hydroxy-tetrahydrodipicolinate reductase [Bacteroidota bacterium]
MNIVIIGYGKMGQEIEKIARERGHQIPLIIDIENQNDLNEKNLAEIDVAIEFTIPENAIPNYQRCFEGKTPVVSGTTGWLDRFNEVKDMCLTNDQSFFYAPNFSLGVNIFFKLNQYLAGIMNHFKDYEVDLTEVHHTQKLDAPSGTAIKLAEDLIEKIERKDNWVLENPGQKENINIVAERKDKVPGIHTIHYESDIDEISITHSAKSRKGFAMGSVLAAEFLARQSPGIYNMDDLLDIS